MLRVVLMGHVARCHRNRTIQPSKHLLALRWHAVEAVIIIFLLFFAVLAFAWFYWQRAKARSPHVESVETAAPAESVDHSH